MLPPSGYTSGRADPAGITSDEQDAGKDFALGKNRKGTLGYLADLGARWGFTVDSVPLLLDPDGPVSSTRIRGFLGAGRVEDAARLLGRPYRIEAQVVRGLGKGHDLGYPTANLELSSTR